jgi:pilus assembly protein Flp/PilA
MNFSKNESGATAIEYGLIAALVAVAIIGTVGAVGNELNSNYYSDIGNNLGTVNTTTP